MTDNTVLAVEWLHGLAARGVSVTLRGNRLSLYPSSAYKELTDNELLTLRHHRQAIKEAVRAGLSVQVATLTTSEGAAPTLAPASEPTPCRWCNRAPCIGSAHPAFYSLHPIEAQQRDNKRATHEMRMTIGNKLPEWYRP